MTQLHQDLHADGKRRRKLLRGTFAAPAVLTVYSGGAAATSVGSCLVKANTVPTTSGIGVTSADDVLFRYQLWGLVNDTNSANISSYWIRGTDLSVFIRNAQMPFLSSSEYQQFDVLNNLLFGIATTTVPSQSGFTFQPVPNWVVLRINGTGALVSAGGAGGGAPVGDSCWNSFFLASPP